MCMDAPVVAFWGGLLRLLELIGVCNIPECYAVGFFRAVCAGLLATVGSWRTWERQATGSALAVPGE